MTPDTWKAIEFTMETKKKVLDERPLSIKKSHQENFRDANREVNR